MVRSTIDFSLWRNDGKRNQGHFLYPIVPGNCRGRADSLLGRSGPCRSCTAPSRAMVTRRIWLPNDPPSQLSRHFRFHGAVFGVLQTSPTSDSNSSISTLGPVLLAHIVLCHFPTRQYRCIIRVLSPCYLSTNLRAITWSGQRAKHLDRYFSQRSWQDRLRRHGYTGRKTSL